MIRTVTCAAALALACAATAHAAPPLSPRAQAWMADIATLSDDAMEGRLTGTAGYDRAASYVIKRMRALKLRPLGDEGGFRQTVPLEQQVIDYTKSSASLIGPSGEDVLAPGHDYLITAGGAPRPAAIDAPLVFIGYGLHLPDEGYDDFKGLDLKGKVAVVISGGPGDLAGPLKSSNRNRRIEFLSKAGAVGVITLTTPKQVEIPWPRQKLLSGGAGMYLADPALRQTPDGFFLASFNPEESQRILKGSGHSFTELAALADASKPVPVFDLPLRIRGTIGAHRQPVVSANVVGVLEGSDPKLKREYVVLSAHLDHLGVGAPINGDAIYNGAMDNASGVASVLDIMGRLKAQRPKRSVVALLVTAEEKGLLGSRYFSRRPTVERTAIVANLNFDMPLPLWPLKTVIAGGEGESTLGQAARAVAAQQGLATTPDPLPERNSFTRTDQYSFVTAGVPAMSFKFGFAKGTPEFEIERNWRSKYYHAPSDAVDQPGVLPEQAIRLNDYVAGIAAAVANDPARPVWLETSPFRRFAVPQ